MGLLKFIFFVIVFYYLLKLIGRYVMPYLFSSFIKRAQDQMMGNNSGSDTHKKSRKEGEVVIDSDTPKASGEKKDNIGEYVDFEEIED